MRRTLPRQLFLYLVPGMLLVLAVAGWSVDTLVDDQLTAYFDTTLNTKARSIMALTEQDEDGVELEIYADALPEFSQSIDPDYFHVVNSVGETLFMSLSASGLNELLPAFQVIDAQGTLHSADYIDYSSESTLNYIDHDLPDGRSGRWVAVSYYPRIDPDDDESIELAPDTVPNDLLEMPGITDVGAPIIVNGELITPERVLTYVGISRVALDQLMWVIDLILLLTGAAIAAAIVLIASLGIKQAIAPLSQLSNDIATVDERSLDTRITLSKPVAELDVVVDQFNKLLERLKTAFNRERQFSADVAHELRTPIAEMRSMIEVHAHFPNDPGIAAGFSDDLLASTQRMQHLVEQLLALSRTEHGVIEIGDPLDLVHLLEECTHNYTDKAQQRDLSLVLEYNEPTVFVSGSLIWPMILTNMLDNAIDHSSGEGPIVVNLEASQDAFCLSISNPCSDIQQKDLTSIFDRLWTKDTSRTESSHTGLGLSLVKAYAKLLELDCDASLVSPSKDRPEQSRLMMTFRGSRCVDNQ